MGLASRPLSRPHLVERLFLRLRGYVSLREAGAFTVSDMEGRKVGIGMGVDIGLLMHDPAPGPGMWHLKVEREPQGIGPAIPQGEYEDWYVRPGAAVLGLVKGRRQRGEFQVASWP